MYPTSHMHELFEMTRWSAELQEVQFVGDETQFRQLELHARIINTLNTWACATTTLVGA
jgi:hypothetical protein